MAVKLTAEKKAELKKIFDKYDADKNGELTLEELFAAFKSAGLPMSKVQVANMLSAADTDGSGTLNYEEYLQYNAKEATKENFDKYDKNGDGVLGPEEVTLLAKDLGYDRVTPKVIKDLINSVDKDGDGVINFQEFQNLNAKK
ncbi:PREDICTED: calmodulin-like [Amphimedon queenslandica]|uniref:EF-hand domain-containing protein n=1 Tax=Amphimedon queenslandica TaxID=400682 RepID=A0A1X7VV92_AMPQE|nr:PREDICTED: calmodulin-like [Amphimedon queenslandica]|eukprot:XP_003382642.1 PREDICTED: calmodulin-like [Amphimedon queenslandica]